MYIMEFSTDFDNSMSACISTKAVALVVSKAASSRYAGTMLQETYIGEIELLAIASRVHSATASADHGCGDSINSDYNAYLAKSAKERRIAHHESQRCI